MLPTRLRALRRGSLLLALVAAIGLPLASAAQQLPPLAVAGHSEAHREAIARAQALIRDSMTANGVPGVSVAVAVDGRVV